MVVSQHQSVKISKSSGTGILNQSHTTIKHNAIEQSGNTHFSSLIHELSLLPYHRQLAVSVHLRAPVSIHQSVRFTSITTTKPVTQVIQSPAASVSLSASLSHAVCHTAR